MAKMRVINDASTVLIDDENPALSLRAVETITTAGRVFNPPIQLNNASMPVIALRSSAGVFITYTTVTSGTRLWYGKISEASPTNQSVTAYIFDRPVDSGANYGLKMWNASGQLVFDAMNKHGRVSAIVTANGTWTGASGRQYAGVVLQHHYKDEVVASETPGYRHRRLWQTGVRIATNGLVVEDVLASDIHYPSADPVGVIIEYGSPRVMIMDVTGY